MQGSRECTVGMQFYQSSSYYGLISRIAQACFSTFFMSLLCWVYSSLYIVVIVYSFLCLFVYYNQYFTVMCVCKVHLNVLNCGYTMHSNRQGWLYNFLIMTWQMSDQVDGWSDIPGSSNTIYLKLPVYTIICNGPTWFINLLATEHCFCVN